jgi:hypothetical protein
MEESKSISRPKAAMYAVYILICIFYSFLGRVNHKVIGKCLLSDFNTSDSAVDVDVIKQTAKLNRGDLALSIRARQSDAGLELDGALVQPMSKQGCD